MKQPWRTQPRIVKVTLQVALWGFVIAALPAVTASVVRADDVADGRKLAQTICVRCHAVGPQKKKGWTNAPSFAEIASRPTTSADWLVAVIQTPHPKMLIKAARSPSEAADIAAYILTLKQ